MSLKMTYSLKGKIILITGGTGSFGRAAAAKLLRDSECAKVIILSRDELKQWEMKQSDPLFNSDRVRYFLGDVRDSQRLARAFREVNVVIHAAALKQVPAAEYNPSEFIKTNILGAMNVIDNAIERGVERVIALSTDKSVNPVNLYGATKLCSDKVFISGNVYVGKRGFPIFSIVRYGNVIGSRGSLLPYWRKLIAEKSPFLPVTDERMTRFWITIDQAVDFVIKRLQDMRGGEIFVPKIPSIKIVDFAEALAPGVERKVVGIRDGEKVHELLISSDEARFTVEYPKYYTILPALFNTSLEQRKAKLGAEGKFVPSGFVYGSDSNPEWLNVQQTKELINNLK
jgi:UDP-N-acetylglucosamine 4,6-dehydratase